MGDKTLFALALFLTACGASMPAPSPSPSPSPAPAPAPAPTTTTTTDDDPSESADPIALSPLVAKNAPRATFPKATVGDRECWQNTAVSGKHQADFDRIIGKCGEPTGLVEYVKPASGHLHHVHDRRDTYRVDLHGGLCYRYFAVADSGITDVDILVETTGGALVATDQMKGSIAIVDGGKPWCQAEDTTLDFHVEVKGEGAGKYVFGVWARPK